MPQTIERLHENLYMRLQQEGHVPGNLMTIASENADIPVFTVVGEMRRGRRDIFFSFYQLLPPQRRQLAQERLKELKVSQAAIKTLMGDAPEIEIPESHSAANFILCNVLPSLFLPPERIQIGSVEIRQDLNSGTMFPSDDRGKHEIPDWLVKKVYETIRDPKTTFTIAKEE